MRWVVLLLLLWQPGQASAHASLLETDPGDGAALAQGPAAVRLRFDEPVGLIALSLVGPAGAVALDGVAVQGDVLGARVPGRLSTGTYLLSWRVTSVDSHPVAGTVAFGVGVAPVAAGAAGGERWLWPSMAVRAVYLAALLVAAGGALFRLVAEPPGAVRRGLAVVAWAGVGLAVGQVGLRGALLLDAPSMLEPGVWRLGAGTTLAWSLGVGAVGLAGCALLAGRAAWMGAVAAVVAMVGLPLAGHAGTASPRWLMGPALAGHGVAAAFWVGAFWPLLGVLRGGNPADAVRRFSRAAVPGVAVLVGSGTVLAVVQVGSWAALVESAYGRVLLVKLALVGALLAVAGWNKWRLTPALARGDAGPLRRSVRGELVLAGLVLGVTGVLGLTPPGRAEGHGVGASGDVPAEGRAVWTQAEGLGAVLAVVPGRVGRNRIAVTIERPAPPREVWLELRQPGAGVAAIRRRLRAEGGNWVMEGPELAVPGRWTFRIEALLSEFDQVSFTTEMELR